MNHGKIKRRWGPRDWSLSSDSLVFAGVASRSGPAHCDGRRHGRCGAVSRRSRSDSVWPLADGNRGGRRPVLAASALATAANS